MEEKPNEQSRPGLNRRRFIGAMGVAAAGGAFLQRGGDAQAASQSQVYYYQDSFGNIAPAGQGAIGLGLYPPTVPAAGLPANAANPDVCTNSVTGTYYNCDYPQYNILLIMVDQMRNPGFWIPSQSDGGQGAINDLLPNISYLASYSLSFPNYWVAATVCGPSRACLLTGLYSQQTCIFRSANYGLPVVNNNSPTPPPLLPYNPNWANNSSNNVNPGFPTIGNVLSQHLVRGDGSHQTPYDCTWIGKWHLSCQTGVQNSQPGDGGPSDYGFSDIYSLPNVTFTGNPYPANGVGLGYPSPNGFENEGAGGDFLDSFVLGANAHNVPNWAASLANNNNYIGAEYELSQVNDAAIAYAFGLWLNHANSSLNGAPAGERLTTPWFCAVSFINPHDIADFPYSFALTPSTNFGAPSNPANNGYQPPPYNNTAQSYNGNNCQGGASNCTFDGDFVTIPAFNNTGPYTSLPPGNGSAGPWNWEDLTSVSKPGLQLYFLNERNAVCGTVASPGAYNNSTNTWPTPTAWLTFLNYYMWMQSCVDYQVGRVLGTNVSGGLLQSPFWGNTVIIFTSDHGDYGGSHGIHSKGGAVYEEVMNVPLYVSYPNMRPNNTTMGTGPTALPFVCSSVDLLPFLYTLALGNHSWRSNSDDMVYYLHGREAIIDAIYAYNNNQTGVLAQRRLSGIKLHTQQGNGTHGWQVYQPFVLHTADDYSPATAGGSYQPSHAVAYRTVDQTDVNNNSAPFYPQNSCGGGKLGTYSFWDTCDTTSAPIKPNNNATNQYEFYNYSIHPTVGSVGNMTVNPQEIGNQYNNNALSQATAYQTDFFSSAVQSELYDLNLGTGAGNNTLQVQAAIQIAYQNYLLWLECMNQMTGNNGHPGNNCVTGFTCPPSYSF